MENYYVGTINRIICRDDNSKIENYYVGTINRIICRDDNSKNRKLFRGDDKLDYQ
jgi:hypothetical protein